MVEACSDCCNAPMTTTNQHLITPPPELVQQWRQQSVNDPTEAFSQTITNLAAQWGADQELEACCEWVRSMFGGHPTWADELLADRRPKPPSLKERIKQAISSGDTGLAIKLLEDLNDTV